MGVLLWRRPSTVICQNPSLALTTLCCLLKRVLSYTLLVDRHSNFKLDSLGSRQPKFWVFHKLSKWSVRKADATIVTNEPLRELVDSWGGRGYVLPDKMPVFDGASPRFSAEMDRRVIVFIASFDTDEPLREFLDACRVLKNDIRVYVTGNYRRAGVVPPVGEEWVCFTGFLTEKEYVGLLARADLIAVLTTEENLLNCGSYEAVALGKPMLLSASEAIRAYFSEGAVYVDNTREGIRAALHEFRSGEDELRAGVVRLRERLLRDWDARYAAVFASTLGGHVHVCPLGSGAGAAHDER
jgi:glycosyltransferase involved in cell wall biosynthesis